MRYCPECSSRHPDGQESCPSCNRPLVALSEDDLVGQELDGRYAILELLGRGGMGQVYRARQRHVERDVAVKVIRRDLGQGEDLVKRFFREARMVAALKNPHVVTLHDFGVTPDGLIYFTMELLDGIPLSTLLREHRRLSWRRAVAIARQICEALEEAHDKNVIHRDLKPENVYVQTTDNRDLARVLDFGLARSLGHGSQLTSPGVVVGTPEYMSPEQSIGVEVDHRSDLYSLGVLLYTMLTGAPPFTGETPLSILNSHVKEAPQAPGVKCPQAEVPSPLDSLVLELLQKSPDHRPQDARSLARRLDHILDGAQGSHAPNGERFEVEVGGDRSHPEDESLAFDETESGALRNGGIEPLTESADLEALHPPRMPPGARGLLGLVLSGALISAALIFWEPWGGTSEDVPDSPDADPAKQGAAADHPVTEPEGPKSPADVVSPELPDLVDSLEVMPTQDSRDVQAGRVSKDAPVTATGPEVEETQLVLDAAVHDISDADIEPDELMADVIPAAEASEPVGAKPIAKHSDRRERPPRIPAAGARATEKTPTPDPPSTDAEMFKLKEVHEKGGIFELKKVEPADETD